MGMKLDPDDAVVQPLQREAAGSNSVFSVVAEAGLRRIPGCPAADERPSRDLPPLPTWKGGAFKVDIADRDALYRCMEEGG